MSHDMTTTNDSRDAMETDIASLLSELSAVQTDLLAVLSNKRAFLAKGDGAGLSSMAAQEEAISQRLQACYDRRQALLAQAASDGKPSDSIRSLSKALPAESRGRLKNDIELARQRSRLVQHECLTNMVIVQRTMLHLSQLIEIIATGGRMKPTYGNGSDSQDHGALVDQAA
jgi:hypothetical protein